MLKRPSSRRKSGSSEVTLNLVPMLDAMVTLIGFLLFTMSFIAFVSIESPLPQSNPRLVQEKLLQKPLQLTVSILEGKTEIWSPFERFPAKSIPVLPDGQPDIRQIHDTVVGVKQTFPKETQIVLVPHAGVSYDTLIAVIDTVRGMEPTDPPIYVRNESTGNDEPVKILFPEVVFGNLLGGG